MAPAKNLIGGGLITEVAQGRERFQHRSDAPHCEEADQRIANHVSRHLPRLRLPAMRFGEIKRGISADVIGAITQAKVGHRQILEILQRGQPTVEAREVHIAIQPGSSRSGRTAIGLDAGEHFRSARGRAAAGREHHPFPGAQKAEHARQTGAFNFPTARRVHLHVGSGA